MESHQENNKRIAKNTIVLYVRMIFVLLVALYTSRVLLDVLGVEDYGVYNVVGGVVTMLGFFNGAMVSSTQRFFSFAIGQEDVEQLNRNYSTILLIQGGLALLVILLAETIGLWFVMTYLVIPPERMSAALWVYHFAVFSFVLSMLQVPFTALIITHERMNVYALISIGDVALKLLLVLALPYLPFDKLISYAVLLFCVALITCSAYVLYCKVRLRYVRVIKRFDRNLFRVLLSYMGWNLWGNSAAVIMGQGINILLNIFFGPAVNAARAIAYQVQGALSQLVFNFHLSLNPSIVKSYSRSDICYMHSLIYKGARLSYLLIFIISLPLLLELPYFMGLWLKEVPDHVITFTRMTIIYIGIDSVTLVLMTGAQASGRIKDYMLSVSALQITALPACYISFRLGAPPEAAFYVPIAIAIASILVRLIVISPLIHLSPLLFVKKVVLAVLIVTVISSTLCVLIKYYCDSMGVSPLVSAFLYMIITSIVIYYLGLEKPERDFLTQKIRDLLLRRN